MSHVFSHDTKNIIEFFLLLLIYSFYVEHSKVRMDIPHSADKDTTIEGNACCNS